MSRTLWPLALVALWGCPKPAASPTEPVDEAEPARPTPPPGTDAYMQGHHAMATGAREAVIAGDRDAWQRIGNQLAGYTSASFGLPDEWQPRLGELTFHGKRLGEANSRADAADAVAEMARTCGVCHTENGPGPAFNFEPAPLDESSVEGRMARHHWAAERMWEGLVTPSASLFETGARALTGAPIWNAEKLPETVAPLEEQLRGLADQALAAEKDSERVQVYGDLLTLCADCHTIARPPE